MRYKMVRSVIFLVIAILSALLYGNEEGDKMTYNKLTKAEQKVILHKGTEAPYSGKYNKNKTAGYYLCKQCDFPLYLSKDKFDSNCGWPSFDDEIPGAVTRVPDQDGQRTEITCANCKGHLGHVFIGERFTKKNTRHCVNSISLNFIPVTETQKAVFASGCFWGPDYFFRRKRGVLETTVGYTGGQTENPTYQEVCTGTTGHAEAIEVVYSPKLVSYADLVKLYFETHDPGQVNRQGPDIGSQYRSEIYYLNDRQKKEAQELITVLKNKGIKVVTRLTPSGRFYPAEDYHQDYYQKKGKIPYCHFYQKKF